MSGDVTSRRRRHKLINKNVSIFWGEIRVKGHIRQLTPP